MYGNNVFSQCKMCYRNIKVIYTLMLRKFEDFLISLFILYACHIYSGLLSACIYTENCDIFIVNPCTRFVYISILQMWCYH